MANLSDEETLLGEIKTYCAEADIKPTTLGLYAVGSSRFVDRLERRVAKSAEDAEAIRKYMREHPPAKRAGKRA